MDFVYEHMIIENQLAWQEKNGLRWIELGIDSTGEHVLD